jgi:hypothetical protein
MSVDLTRAIREIDGLAPLLPVTKKRHTQDDAEAEA